MDHVASGYQHEGLASGRWGELSFAEQMENSYFSSVLECLNVTF